MTRNFKALAVAALALGIGSAAQADAEIAWVMFGEHTTQVGLCSLTA